MVGRVFKLGFIVCLFIATACESKRFEANISTQNYEIRLERVDQQAFTNNSSFHDLYGWMQNLEDEHPDFATIYLSNIMRVGSSVDSAAAHRLLAFTSDTLWQGVTKDIWQAFGDFEPEHREISQAAKRVRYFLPEVPVPTIYTFNSGFNVAVYPDSNVIGLGLEWFLNPEHPTVELLPPNQFPMYKRKRMEPEWVVASAVRGWLLQQQYDPYYFQQDLLREMIFYGKVLWLTEVALPENPLEQILNYNKEELAWAVKNQEAVWQQLVGRDLLFTTNGREIAKLTTDGPFTNGFGNNSSPRLGWYLGYTMVKQYADKSGLDLPTILKEYNEQEILRNFRPDKTPE